MTLHLMKIVHFDIKPDNLMWSNHFKREVFIDFGLSEIIEGGPGFKYLVEFKGSPNYCMPEMSFLMIHQLKRYIDVYYNDVHCLK
jgi:serine/threonine protein kinase